MLKHTFERIGSDITLHSQPETGQDEWVLRMLKGKEGGTFLELGAYDGVYHSNTLCLEQDFAWTGWLIESDSNYASAARSVRKAHVVNATIGPDVCTRPYYVGGQWSGLVDFTRPNLVHGHVEHDNPIVHRPTVQLQTVLRDLWVPPIIDYFSLDVEGAEYPILENYFTNNPPAMFRLITIEIGIYADDLTKLCDLLDPLGYRLDRITKWESYWCHRSLCK